MALFTDGPVSTIEDLAGEDSHLLDVASVEGIDVTRKLALAQDELALDLEALFARLSSPFPGVGSVVVTPALKLWHMFRTLETIYRDAYASQLSERYAKKRDAFHERGNWAYEKLIQSGIGIVTRPVPQAATPDIVPTPGGLPDGIYYVTMAWTNSEGEEGACAVPGSIATAGSTLRVRVKDPPEIAAGWNVYAGATADSMVRQNQAPIAVGQDWVQPDTLGTAGQAPASGQAPSYTRAVPRRIPRG